MLDKLKQAIDTFIYQSLCSRGQDLIVWQTNQPLLDKAHLLTSNPDATEKELLESLNGLMDIAKSVLGEMGKKHYLANKMRIEEAELILNQTKEQS